MTVQLVLQHLFEGSAMMSKVIWETALFNFDPTDFEASNHMIKNHPSIKTAKRLGFIPEGITHNARIDESGNTDPVVLSFWHSMITSEDWFRVKHGVKKHLQDLVDRKEGKSSDVLVMELNSSEWRQKYLFNLGKLL